MLSMDTEMLQYGPAHRRVARSNVRTITANENIFHVTRISARMRDWPDIFIVIYVTHMRLHSMLTPVCGPETYAGSKKRDRKTALTCVITRFYKKEYYFTCVRVYCGSVRSARRAAVVSVSVLLHTHSECRTKSILTMRQRGTRG